MLYRYGSVAQMKRKCPPIGIDVSMGVVDNNRGRGMNGFMQERRRLLRSAAAWVVGAAGLATTRSAKAWEMQKLSPTSPLGVAYANHCSETTDHAWLISALKTELAQDPSLASPLSATCPLCGCPVIVGR
jgi:hypothetical protein